MDPADRRCRLVTLTAVEKAKLEESQRLWWQAQHRFEATFGPEQASALRQSIAVIASAGIAKAFQDAGDSQIV